MASAQHQALMASTAAPYVAPARTFLGQLTSTTDSLTTYNLGSISVPQDCLLVVVILRRTGSSASMSSVSIDGGSAAMYGANTSSTQGRIIAARRVSAGSRSVSFTLSGSAGTNTVVAVGVYAITGTLASDIPVGFGDFSGASVSTRTITFDRGNGVAVFGASANASVTFSYTTAISDLDSAITNSATMDYNFASVVTTAAAAVAETATISSATSGQFIGAAWA